MKGPKFHSLSSPARLARRRVTPLRVLACILAGALLTLAAAWGPEFVVRDFEAASEWQGVTDGAGRPIGFRLHAVWADYCIIDGDDILGRIPGAKPFERSVVARKWVALPPDATPDVVLTYATGWPFRTLRCVEVEKLSGRNTAYGKWEFDAVHTIWEGLPLIPIWPGLLANTVFWSAIAAAPIFGVPALRRWRRARRGACRECGYERSGLASNAPCPECGATRELR